MLYFEQICVYFAHERLKINSRKFLEVFDSKTKSKIAFSIKYSNDFQVESSANDYFLMRMYKSSALSCLEISLGTKQIVNLKSNKFYPNVNRTR